MKLFYSLLLIAYSFTSCSDPLTTDTLIQDEIAYSGFWEVHLSGDLSGAATIPIRTQGEIHNGVPINFGVASVITYIKGQVDNNGSLQAEFYNSFVKDTIKIISDGTFTGTFSDSSCSGQYHLITNDTLSYSGTWQGFRIE